MRVVMTHGARLFGGFFRTRDDVLVFDRLDPESWREVSQVGNDGDKGAPGINRGPAFANLPIEMGDYGNQQVRWLFPPELLEQIHERPVKNPDGGLKHAKELGAAECPAILQHNVVLLLDADSREFA